jgi:hypothetical protein
MLCWLVKRMRLLIVGYTSDIMYPLQRHCNDGIVVVVVLSVRLKLRYSECIDSLCVYCVCVSEGGGPGVRLAMAAPFYVGGYVLLSPLLWGQPFSRVIAPDPIGLPFLVLCIWYRCI